MRKEISGCLVILLLTALSASATFAQSASQSTFDQSPRPITPAMEQKVDAMVKKLTLEQKIALIGGENNMFIRAMPGIGFPQLKMSDGPMGVRTWGPSTAYAAGIGLAASWDTALAKEVGTAIGQDARARGVNFLLGPGVNIYRMPMNGRNFEYFGEDPYLDAQITVGYIDGVQSQGVSATVKHFALNNSEFDRHNENSVADERTMREIYLPAFEAAVKDAHVGAIMDSYNLVNGEHSTQNNFLNIQVLRKDWGFRGIVMSDWYATYDGIAAANGGLDLEMPDANFMTASTLLPAIQSGKVSEAVVDQKVRRILRTAMQFQFLDRPQRNLNVSLYNQHGNEITLKAAEEGAVLLKNDGNLLPLSRAAIHSIAVIGPDAYPAVPTGGGSAHVTAISPVSFMTGLSNTLTPGTKAYWDPGVKSPDEIFSTTEWCADTHCKQSGLNRAEYVLSANERLYSTVDKTVNKAHGSWMWQDLKTPRRIEWYGYYVPKTSGTYVVAVSGGLRSHYQVEIDGKKIVTGRSDENNYLLSAPILLKAGKPAQVVFNYFPGQDDSGPSLGITPENSVVDGNAVKLARMADIVVLSVGFSPDTESEGMDRTYHLQFGQEQLIQAVTAANPRTIVVLTAGGSVATADWIDKVPALLQTWYAGQQGGNALTKILFGDVNPSGKLPVSWERKLADNPAYNNYYEQPGTNNVNYSEGVFLGYRYYDTKGVQPLFPFGFGLSYTRFVFSKLSVSPASTSAARPITVSFDVKNIGQRTGAEVAQIYIGDPSATVPRPKMELKGFARIQLSPGETRHVTATLNKRSLAYWDVNTHGWKIDPGKFIVYVGNSSENVPLQQSFTVQ